MQRSYTRPQPTKSQTNLAPFFLISFLLFLLIILYGSYQFLKEIRSISDGQQILILKLTETESKKLYQESKESEEDTYESEDAVNRIEFIKHRNETRKALRDMNYQIRLIQTKLKMKKMPLLRD